MPTVRLIWDDNANNEDGQRVYRSTSPIDPLALPTPLASIAADVRQYDDTTAVEDTVYYYRISTYRGTVESVSDEIVVTATVSALPAVADDNAIHDADLTSTASWTGDTVDLLSTGRTLGLNGADKDVSHSFAPATVTSGDFVVYYRLQLQSGSATWTLHPSGGEEVQLSLGYRWSTGFVAPGWVSFAGKNAGVWSSTVEFQVDYTTAFVELTAQYDSRVGIVNMFRKVAGAWVLEGHITADSPYPGTEMRVVTGADETYAAVTWDWLLARPNLVAIGDDITAGHTLFDPDPAVIADGDYQSTWMAHAPLYPYRRNNVIVNQGVAVPGTSADIDSRMNAMLTAALPRVVFLGCSSNDFSVVTLADRTTNVQAAVDKAVAASAAVVLHNAVYPNSASAEADFYRDWWENELANVTGASLNVDIMEGSGILNGGTTMDTVNTQADGRHPNVVGYTLVGEFIGGL